MKIKVLMGLLAILAIVIFIIVRADKRKNEQAAFEGNVPKQARSGESSPAKLSELPPVQKTTSPDAVIDGIVADYSQDAGIAAEGDADAQYISDSTALINSEGVYNANEF